jgi:hypothetical protein
VCRARVAWRRGFDALQFVCCRQGEGACTARNESHALGVHGACAARSEHGLQGDKRTAWVAAGYWATSTVAGGCWWCGGRGWLVPCTLVGMSELGVASGFEGEGERLRLSRHWPVGF